MVQTLRPAPAVPDHPRHRIPLVVQSSTYDPIVVPQPDMHWLRPLVPRIRNRRTTPMNHASLGVLPLAGSLAQPAAAHMVWLERHEPANHGGHHLIDAETGKVPEFGDAAHAQFIQAVAEGLSSSARPSRC
jgi:hypothetical protein